MRSTDAASLDPKGNGQRRGPEHDRGSSGLNANYERKHMERKYTFIEDPGHGWLEVPENDLLGTGLIFSKYSPRRNGIAYLEEDCDAPKFLDYLEKMGITVRTTMRYVESFSR